jgi:hypothetical protein
VSRPTADLKDLQFPRLTEAGGKFPRKRRPASLRKGVKVTALGDQPVEERCFALLILPGR